ncbi:MAG: hypothetical protein QOH42_784 [Blastocatellia bacterium]|nr:hypothetical protein [Blastocatellia bacterium]
MLAHPRRWDRAGIAQEHFVEYNGKPVLSVKKAFRKVVKLAKIDTSEGNVTPHTLRHTAATWLMQRGVPIWVAAGYLGMTAETLERNYGHHHPDHLSEAVEGITTAQEASGPCLKFNLGLNLGPRKTGEEEMLGFIGRSGRI